MCFVCFAKHVACRGVSFRETKHFPTDFALFRGVSFRKTSSEVHQIPVFALFRTCRENHNRRSCFVSLRSVVFLTVTLFGWHLVSAGGAFSRAFSELLVS